MIGLDNELNLRPIGAEIAERLEAAIVREVFAPGEALREVELCARFNVSRSPLREALQILESWSLVERRPRYGARVTAMSLENLDEITIARAPLEATCARLLAERPDRASILPELEAALAAMRAAVPGTMDGFEANVRLTQALHRHCGNSVLSRLLSQLDKPALRYRFRAYRQAPRLVGDMIAANAGMIDAIRDGDAPRTMAITSGLVEQAWAVTRPLFAEGA